MSFSFSRKFKSLVKLNEPKLLEIEPNYKFNSNDQHVASLKNSTKVNQEVQAEFQPFKMQMVENIRISTREERLKWINDANNNLFNLKPEQIMIDLLTDSANGSSLQTNGKHYSLSQIFADSASLSIFTETVQGLIGYKHSFSCLQRRSAEQVLFKVLECKNRIIPCNTLSWSTLLNLEQLEGKVADVICEDSLNFLKNMPFKGKFQFIQRRITKNSTQS